MVWIEYISTYALPLDNLETIVFSATSAKILQSDIIGELQDDKVTAPA